MKALVGKFIYFFIGPFVFPFVLKNSERSRVLLISGDKILLVRSMISGQHWNLPGGGTAANETNSQGAARELLEETGIVVAAKKLKELGSNTYRSLNTAYTCVYFMVETNNQTEPKPGFDILESGWFDINELPSNLHPSVSDALAMRKGTLEP